MASIDNNNTHSDNEEVPIKMYFSTNELKKDVLAHNDNTSTAYIIMQNRKLHARVKELEQQINDVEVEKNAAEDEVDSLTKSRTCLQGYIKNELEYAENWKTVSNIYNEQLNRYLDVCLKYLFLNMFYILLLAFCPFKIRVKLTLTVAYITMMLYYCGINLYSIYNNHTKDDVLVEVKKNIQKIEKSNLYIQDLIDNI